jgi:phage terminase Nu1 subunit (DNA packaging protein)
MSALSRRQKMRAAPRLVHDADGLVLVQLGEHSVVFPTEADARFFFEAYADVPNLASQNAYLREQIDEGSLANAQARATELEAEVAALRHERSTLQMQLATLAEKAASSARRARILALALKNGITPQ